MLHMFKAYKRVLLEVCEALIAGKSKLLRDDESTKKMFVSCLQFYFILTCSTYFQLF